MCRYRPCNVFPPDQPQIAYGYPLTHTPINGTLHYEEYLQSMHPAYMFLGWTSTCEVHNRFMPNCNTGEAACQDRWPSEPLLSQNKNSVSWCTFSPQKIPWAYASNQFNWDSDIGHEVPSKAHGVLTKARGVFMVLWGLSWRPRIKKWNLAQKYNNTVSCTCTYDHFDYNPVILHKVPF